MISSPNIVENQCGFSDSSQSIDMNVTLKPQKIRPGPLIAAILLCEASRLPDPRAPTTC